MDEPRLFPPNPAYRVFTDGRIESCLQQGSIRLTETWHAIRPAVVQGYRRFHARIDGRWRLFAVHQAVLLAFVGPCPEGMEVRHLDGAGTNNRLDNLAYGTKQENAADKEKHGTTLKGRVGNTYKLTPEQRASIRAEYAAGGATQTELAARHGVTRSAVGYHVRGVVRAGPVALAVVA